MTYSTLFPFVLGTYVPKEKVNKPPKQKKPSKYDHKQMLEDRMSGMSWIEIGKKHCVSSKTNLGSTTCNIAMNSKATHMLTPEQVRLLGD